LANRAITFTAKPCTNCSSPGARLINGEIYCGPCGNEELARLRIEEADNRLNDNLEMSEAVTKWSKFLE
jgi:uncharacterized Zn finger protein (UPF0148 family)